MAKLQTTLTINNETYLLTEGRIRACLGCDFIDYEAMKCTCPKYVEGELISELCQTRMRIWKKVIDLSNY